MSRFVQCRIMAKIGRVRRVEGERGYRGELDWLASRINAGYFLKIRDAVITVADELKALEDPARSRQADEGVNRAGC